MYIQKYKKNVKGVEYFTYFIAESYRENGKVKRRHLANLSGFPIEAINGFSDVLKNLNNTSTNINSNNININNLDDTLGKSFGALYVFNEMMKKNGISKALGNSKQARLAILQICSRIIAPDSRNAIANEWADSQAIEEVLKLTKWNEDSLYINLKWIAENQSKIEKSLFKSRHKNVPIKNIYLYDVTSSYFEGKENELAFYGYNRDKKKGKTQIVIGLLCDSFGYPVSIEVFNGNTADTKTVSNQLKKLSNLFGVKNVIFVGDRGMIKSNQIEEINEINFNYITAITKNQIESLIKNKSIQIELFNEKITEVECDNVRYVLRKNPYRTVEIQQIRKEKKEIIENKIEEFNKFLMTHPKSKTKTYIEKTKSLIKKFKLNFYLDINIDNDNRKIKLIENTEKLKEEEMLDGCYIIKSDISKNDATAEEIHSRYKDLSFVEQAFRTLKQSIEEIRPIYVRKESHTRGHVFICMLAYIVIRDLQLACEKLKRTRKGLISTLDSVKYNEIKIKQIVIKKRPKNIPQKVQDILDCLKINLPNYL